MDSAAGRSLDMDVARLGVLWRGEESDAYAEATIAATAAVALRLLGRAGSFTEADRLARMWWTERPRDGLAA